MDLMSPDRGGVIVNVSSMAGRLVCNAGNRSLLLNDRFTSGSFWSNIFSRKAWSSSIHKSDEGEFDRYSDIKIYKHFRLMQRQKVLE